MLSPSFDILPGLHLIRVSQFIPCPLSTALLHDPNLTPHEGTTIRHTEAPHYTNTNGELYGAPPKRDQKISAAAISCILSPLLPLTSSRTDPETSATFSHSSLPRHLSLARNLRATRICHSRGRRAVFQKRTSAVFVFALLSSFLFTFLPLVFYLSTGMFVAGSEWFSSVFEFSAVSTKVRRRIPRFSPGRISCVPSRCLFEPLSRQWEKAAWNPWTLIITKRTRLRMGCEQSKKLANWSRCGSTLFRHGSRYRFTRGFATSPLPGSLGYNGQKQDDFLKMPRTDQSRTRARNAEDTRR